MDIKVDRRDGGLTVLSPSGRLNMTSAIDLRETIGAVVSAGDVYIVVDLSDIEFIDSSGLGGLISGLKTAREAGGDLRIAAPSEQVQLVLQLTNLGRVLVHYDDTEAALASWA